MSATQILSGLETLDLKGEAATAAARLGFLEWVFGQTGEATPKDAQDALSALGQEAPESAAAQAFVTYLQQACLPAPRPQRRLGRARRLH